MADPNARTPHNFAAGSNNGVPWGLWMEPIQPVARLVELATLAESLGASACFIADEGTERDLYVALTAVVTQTGLTVVPAITNPFSRHPVTTAAAIATLAELAPGRVWHGLGVGGSRVLDPLGMAPERPYTALREALEVNRRLLSGESSGEASLPWFKGDVPIAIAGRGPRVQRLAATASDGVILSAVAPADLPDATARIRAAGSARIIWSAYLAYNEVERRRVLGHFTYMALDSPPEVKQAAGLDAATEAELRRLMLAGHMTQAAELLPESLVDIYALAGTPTEIAAKIADYRNCHDMFALPLNDTANAEAHIQQSATILQSANTTPARPPSPQGG